MIVDTQFLVLLTFVRLVVMVVVVVVIYLM